LAYRHLIVILAMVWVLAAGRSGAAQPDQPAEMASLPGMEVVLLAGEGDSLTRVPAPRPLGPITSPATTIAVDFIGDWSGEAQAAFAYGAAIWASLISSSQPIVVEAHWSPLGAGVLGSAGATSYYRDFPNRPHVATWYPVGLANHLAGYDLNHDANGDKPEMRATFNSAFSAWYFGTDGNTPANKYDFVSVVLHELGHGLGFAGSMRVASGIGSWGFTSSQSPPYRPTIYDRFAANASFTSLIDTGAFPNPSAALASQLTSNGVFFGGSQAMAAHGGARPKLYAPASWAQGSSYSHLDEATYPAGSPHSLMTPSLANGESVHSPGTVTLAMLGDLGWQHSNTTPALASLPGQLLLVNTSKNNAVDLWAYAGDAESPDNQLTFAIANSPTAQAGVTLDAGRYVDIDPAGGWTGQTQVTIRVADPGGLAATSTFWVAVAAELHNDYLPALRR
jgi:hypothetical protein